MGTKSNKENNLLNKNFNYCKDIQFIREITNDSYIYRLDNNTITIFKSFINQITYLIYSNKEHSISKKVNTIT